METMRISLMFWAALTLFCPDCIAQEDHPTDSKKPIALIAGDAVFEEQLPPNIAGQLHRLNQHEFETRRAALEDLVNRRLLEAEARRRSITVDKLLETEADSKIADPTAAELQAYYKQQKGNASESFDQAQPRLKNELKQIKLRSAREAYLKVLRDSAVVRIFLEPPKVKVNYDPSRLKGNANARITIVEFADFACPFCRQVDSTLTKLIAKYEGKVKLAYRDFPVGELHPQAQLAAEASRCASEQNKFWEYHDFLFQNSGTLSREDLTKGAEELRLDSKQFDSCLSSGKYKSQIDQDVQDGIRAGVFGTPGFFINGVFLAGAQPAAAFEKIIDEELEQETATRWQVTGAEGIKPFIRSEFQVAGK